MTSLKQLGDEIEEYLLLKRDTTQSIYRSAFRNFLEYYETQHGEGKGFTHFLDRVFDELQKPRREQRRVAEIEVVQFVDFLKQKGKSGNSIRTYFAAVQSFLKTKGAPFSAKLIGNLPPAVEKKENHKHQWRIEELKEFIQKLPTYRDKSIALAIFQKSLRYGSSSSH